MPNVALPRFPRGFDDPILLVLGDDLVDIRRGRERPRCCLGPGCIRPGKRTADNNREYQVRFFRLHVSPPSFGGKRAVAMVAWDYPALRPLLERVRDSLLDPRLRGEDPEAALDGDRRLDGGVRLVALEGEVLVDEVEELAPRGIQPHAREGAR